MAFTNYLFLIRMKGKRFQKGTYMIDLHYFGHKVIEEQPFSINRPEGSSRFIFFHFITPVIMHTEEGTFEAPPGSCILYTPGVKQKFEVIKNRLNHDYLDFLIDDEKFFSVLKFPLNKIFNPYISDGIKLLFKKIIEERQTGRPDSKYLISCYLEEFFIETSRKLNKTKRYKKETTVFIEKLEEIRLRLYHNPKENHVRDMADALGYSLPYFSYLYKKYLKVTPVIDLNLARIAYVNNHRDDFKSIDELTDALGFSSQEFFYRWFKTNFKMTPKEYFQNN